MSNINNQSKDINAIAGVQEISDETAAIYCGGEMVLWDGKNFTGQSLVVSGGIRDLKGFKNRTSSLKITNDKIWAVYKGLNYTGQALRIQGQQFKNLGLFGFNNNVKSLRPLG